MQAALVPIILESFAGAAAKAAGGIAGKVAAGAVVDIFSGGNNSKSKTAEQFIKEAQKAGISPDEIAQAAMRSSEPGTYQYMATQQQPRMFDATQGLVSDYQALRFGF